MLANYYRNPFTGEFGAESVANERKVVGPFDPDLGPTFHGIRLAGAPLFGASPAPELWTCSSELGPLVLQLAETTGTPGPNQFRVDYGDAETGAASGMVWINVPDGTWIDATYQSVGAPLTGENLTNLVLELAGNLALPIGSLVPCMRPTLPAGRWLWAEGALVSRAAPYTALFDEITYPLGAVTITPGTPALCTLVNHGLLTEDCIELTTSGSLPVGLSVFTEYFVIRLTADTFRLATTPANAAAGTAVSASAPQSGTHQLRWTPCGTGSSASSFRLPDTRGVHFVGDGTTSRTSAYRGTNASGGFYAGRLGRFVTDQLQRFTIGDSTNPSRTITVIDPGRRPDPGTVNANYDIIGLSNLASFVRPVAEGAGAPRTGSDTHPAALGVRWMINY